jgi:hypothetical protein
MISASGESYIAEKGMPQGEIKREVSYMATIIKLARQYCPNCNAEIAEAAFPYCQACDAEINYCPGCQRPLDIDAEGCPYCGADLVAGDS